MKHTLNAMRQGSPGGRVYECPVCNMRAVMERDLRPGEVFACNGEERHLVHLRRFDWLLPIGAFVAGLLAGASL